jgi:hypothetical protein
MGMMDGAPPSGKNVPAGMMQQIRQFAGMIGNRNPEQMVRNMMRQKGIPESELRNAMQQAREIAGMMGMK